MEETLNVKIKVDSAQANSSLKQTTRDMGSVRSGADGTSEALNKVATSLSKISGFTPKNLVKGFTELSNSSNIRNSISDIEQYYNKAKDYAIGFSDLSTEVGELSAKVLKSVSNFGEIDISSFLEDDASKISTTINKLNNSILKHREELKLAKVDWLQLLRDSKAYGQILDALGSSLYAMSQSNSKDFEDKIQKNGVFTVGLGAEIDGVKRVIAKEGDDLAVVYRKILEEYQSFLAEFANANQAVDFEKLFKIVPKNTAEVSQSVDGVTESVGEATEKLKGLERILDKLLPGSMKRIKDIGKEFNNMGISVKKVGLSLAVVVLYIKAISSQIKSAFKVSQLGDEIDKNSQRVGLSAKNYQKWAYVLERCGIEIGTLKTAMRSMMQLSQQSNNLKYFQQLGIEDPTALSQEALFGKVVEGLQKIEDPTERLRVSMKTLGRSAAELAPLLGTSADEVSKLAKQYDLLGATMSDTLVKNSAALQDAVTDLKVAWQGLKNSLASNLVPILTNVVNKITVFVAKINIIVRAIMGIEWSVSDISDSVSEATNNTAEFSNEVKKLKTLIAGFDELNIFPSESDTYDFDMSDVDFDFSGISSVGQLSDYTAGLEEFKNKIDGVKEELQKIVPIGTTAAGVLLAVLGFCTGSIPVGIAGLGLAGIGIQVGASNGTWKEIIDGVVKQWNRLSDWWETTDLHKLIKTVWDNIGIFFNSTVAELFNGTAWAKMYANLAIWWDESNLKKSIENAWNVISSWFKSSVAPKFTFEYWTDKFKSIVDSINSVGILGTIKKIWNDIKEWYHQNMDNPFSVAYWLKVFRTITQGFNTADIFLNIVNMFTNIKSWFNSSVKPKFTVKYWQDLFTSIREGLSKITLKDIAKSIANGFIDIIERMINKSIDAINSLATIKVGGAKIFSADIGHVSIPRLAKGGVIDEPTMAMIGEYSNAKTNPEIVAPQSIIKQTIDASNEGLADVFMQVGMQVIKAIQDKDLSVNLGDTQIAQSASRGNNQYYKMTGQYLFG